ncbi:hypothetical protein ACEQ8H_004137 [Pleosporales sp. CAS-2024a]
MDMRRLSNSELKKLVSILHENATQEDIQALPSRLRSVHPSSSGSGSGSSSKKTKTSCSLHKDLDANVVHHVWRWIRYELERGIGKHVFPVLMADKLSRSQERKMRAIEPVLEMWRLDFDRQAVAPAGRAAMVDTGSKWAYQRDQCRGCMLARIGSDNKVLRALHAGMVARFPLRTTPLHKLLLAELGVGLLDNFRSRRIRFVRYWMQATTGDDALVQEATELGMLIKHKYRECMGEDAPETPAVYRGGANKSSSRPSGHADKVALHTTHPPRPCSPVQHVSHHRRLRSDSHSTLAPRHIPPHALSPVLVNLAHLSHRHSHHTPESMSRRTSFHPSAAPSPLAPKKRGSNASSSTVLSYDGPWADRLDALSEVQRGLVDAGFGQCQADPFEGVDSDMEDGDKQAEGACGAAESEVWDGDDVE